MGEFFAQSLTRYSSTEHEFNKRITFLISFNIFNSDFLCVGSCCTLQHAIQQMLAECLLSSVQDIERETDNLSTGPINTVLMKVSV